MSTFSHAYTPKKTFDLLSYSYYPFSLGKMMMMTQLWQWWWWCWCCRLVGSLLTRHLLHRSVWGEVVDMCNLIVSQRCTNQHPPPLPFLMTFCSQMKIFPFPFFPFLIIKSHLFLVESNCLFLKSQWYILNNIF